ncbi:MAG: hypothetical protein ACJAV1_002333 [Paraglaciecola sp.]|jgi:hypothetical protein
MGRSVLVTSNRFNLITCSSSIRCFQRGNEADVHSYPDVLVRPPSIMPQIKRLYPQRLFSRSQNRPNEFYHVIKDDFKLLAISLPKIANIVNINLAEN